MSTHELLAVSDSSQISAARFAAHAVATTAGFDGEDVHRAGLVATELASNLVKHTPEGGKMLFRPSTERDGGGMEITAIDRGPGIVDWTRAMSDGYSTTGTLGGGLGAVRRLTDECDVYSSPGKGTAIAVHIRRDRLTRAPERFKVAGVGVPARGERVCGDAWDSWTDVRGLRIAMFDGLGHGPDAARAAQLAIQVVATSVGLSEREAIQSVHAALRPTRGAAGAIATIDTDAALVRFVGVGNIGCVVSAPGDARNAVSMGGTLGHEARSFKDFVYAWPGGAGILIMYSDGLSSHWSLDDYPGLRACSPAVIAAVLYRDFNRGRDDATVVVAKEAQ